MTLNLKKQLPEVADKALTVLLTSVATIFVLGKKAGKAYFDNREEVNEDLRVFAEAVVEGAKRAYTTAYQLGAEARVAFEDNKPAVEEALDKVYCVSMDSYNTVRCYLEDLKLFR